MNEREFFYRLGKSIYQIDAAYEKYGSIAAIKAPNLLWILYALNDGKMHSQRQICDDWAIPRSTANTIIKDLERKKYIELSLIKGKRRELQIILNEKGKVYANRLLSKLYEKEKEIFQKLDNAENFLLQLESFVNKLEVLKNEN